MPTSSLPAATSAAAELKKLESAYGPQAQAASHAAAGAYFASLPAVELVSVIISALFVAGIVYIILKTGWLRTRLDRINHVILKSNAVKKRMERSWSEIERHFFSGNDNDLRIAIIKADVLLDEALREAGIPGSDLGDRLKKMTAAKLPNLDNVWEAHRLRNRIAHETEFALKRDLAERALTVYEEALEHLGALSRLATEEPPTDRPENRSPQSH